jgi:hypothetical protein
MLRFRLALPASRCVATTGVATALASSQYRSVIGISDSPSRPCSRQHGLVRCVSPAARWGAIHARGGCSGGSRGGVAPTVAPRLVATPRHFVGGLMARFRGGSNSAEELAKSELQQNVYDRENRHYTGKIFGVSTDALFFYLKVGAIILTVYLVVWVFVAGWEYLMSFSLATVGRLGFMAGFWCCAILVSTAMQLKTRYFISPNAVYNQAIALVMKEREIADFLGSYPRTGDFRAYCATGGFKLPLLRRIRSGTYELADLLGTKPQRLQMMFVLRSGKREALVSCDVRKMHTRLFSSSYHFKSLAVHLRDDVTSESKSCVLLGRPEDVIYEGIIRF